MPEYFTMITIFITIVSMNLCEWRICHLSGPDFKNVLNVTAFTKKGILAIFDQRLKLEQKWNSIMSLILLISI